MSPEEKFWKWFESNQSEYLYLDTVAPVQKEELLNQLLNRLHEYCDKLYFQVGGNPDKLRRELVITAEGNLEYFEAVEKLIAAAPKFENWRIIAFKQPMGIDFITTYEGLTLDPKSIWFLPLSNSKKPEMIGIRVCIHNYDSNEAKKYKLAVYQILDTILGEKATATEIDYLDVESLSNYDLEKDGLIKLVELPSYLTSKKG